MWFSYLWASVRKGTEKMKLSYPGFTEELWSLFGVVRSKRCPVVSPEISLEQRMWVLWRSKGLYSLILRPFKQRDSRISCEFDPLERKRQTMFLKINVFEHKTEKLHESNLLCLMAISISVSTTFSGKITVELAFLFNQSLDIKSPQIFSYWLWNTAYRKGTSETH